MKNRISSLIQNSDRKLLIPFFTGGFPTKNKFLDLIKVAIDSGSDIIEIGLPFSDPLADGHEVQYSSHIALKKNIRLNDIFILIEKIRSFSEIPLVLMGYYNPVLAYGEKRFFKKVKSLGVDGLIIPDLPVDEAEEYTQFMEISGLSSIFLISPTSDDNRIKAIDYYSSDFIYAVTVTGVTGTGKVFDRATDNYLKRISKQVSKKIVAGFGVSSADDAKRLAKYTDGVVIGSAFIKIIRNEKNFDSALIKVSRLLRSIRRAI
ncbi:MAG: tryptophan synthase subunit alpha [candidate division Zixibacteria bacterium]|nr:tryptophan synthase subunit alpha [candidate division Zixibacteria bacterium]